MSRLLVFSDDWGRHPSSSQHLVRHLLPRYRVDWVNTIGTRRPRPRAADLRRGLEKVRQWLGGSRAGAAALHGSPPPLNPRVHCPVHWPGFGGRLERGLNRHLLLRALRPLLTDPDPPLAAVSTLPIVADLARARADIPWIYYCVDDLAEWPGLDAAALRAMERDFLATAHAVIAVSEHLCGRMRALGHDAALLTHGIDLDHWRGGPADLGTGAGPTHGEGRPTALYWGYADGRLDVAIVLALAERCHVRMVGPIGEVDPRLRRHPGVAWSGPVPYEDLPALAREADVLVMPYADLPVTRAMQPLKLKEYLATGRPVVATPLPANLHWADAMDVSADPDAFTALCLERAGRPLPDGQRSARRRLEQESWAEKALRFEAIVLEAARSARSSA